MNAILGGLLATLVLVAIFTTLERLFRRRRLPRVEGSHRVDLLYWPLIRLGDFLTSVTFAIWALGISIVTGIGPANLGAVFEARFRPFATLPVAVQVVIALLAVDLVGYWVHRLLFHASPLWRFHAIHHSAERLDWFAAARNHPLMPAVAGLAHAVPLLWVGIDPRVAMGVGPVVGLWAVLLHANVPWRFGLLRFVVATPMFHRWHHARDRAGAQGVNFAALFPIWDLIFRTYHCPAREPEAFGTDEPVPRTFFGQLAYPFRRR